MIYLIESQDYYKIGYTKNITSRLKSYNTTNPNFTLLLTEEGDTTDESTLHHLCKEYRYKLEWFHKNPKILEIWNTYFSNKPKENEVSVIVMLDNSEFYSLSKAESNVLSVAWLMSSYYSDPEFKFPGNRISCDKQFRDIVHNKTGLAESTIKAAIASLAQKEMLLKDKEYKGIYYLNPDYFFKGKLSDRTKAIKQITEYIIS